MPVLESYLHYRIIDVSSIKELSRRWYPRVYFNAPKKSGGHRALADIRESIAELRYYRQAVFVPPARPRQRHRQGARDAPRHRALSAPVSGLRCAAYAVRRGGHEHLARACSIVDAVTRRRALGPGSCCAWWV